MNVRFILFLCGSIAAGILASGIIQPSGGTLNTANNQVDNWRTPHSPVNYSQSKERFLNSLSSGQIFPNLIRRFEDTIDEESIQTERTVFPTIVSISKVDGEFQAFVEYETGDRKTLAEGDNITEFWTVINLSQDALIAGLEQERVRLPLFYLPE